MGTLNIMVGQEQGNVSVTVLRVEGDIDASTHNILEEKGSEVIAAGASNILLDLSGVHYMGSAGFRAIHAVTNMLDNSESVGISKSKHLKLYNPSDEVSRVIKTLGFDSFLEIFRDRDEAVNSF